MATTFACLKGKMGTTDYYLIKMKAGSLINTVGYASQIADWDDMDIEERMQRRLDEKRVINELVPYLVNDEDRFFGSLIVDVYQGWDSVQYEPLSDITKVNKAAYQAQAEEFGFVTIPDNQMLIALDGQHRLLALNVAIKGWRGLPGGVKITEEMKDELRANADLINEDINVMLIPHEDNVKIRKIFNKINRYAKSTSRGDDIITDEDDIYAIISRRLLRNGEPLGSVEKQSVVNYSSNTLSQRSKHLTTLSAVYSINEEVIGKLNKKVRPANQLIDDQYEKVCTFWNALLDNVDDFKEYFKILEKKSNKDIGDFRDESLLMKPVTHMAIGNAYGIAQHKNIPLETFAKKLNTIPWNYDSTIWKNILVMSNSRKVMSGKQVINNAGRLIAYMIDSSKFSDAEKTELLGSLQLSDQSYQLPECN